MINVILQFNSNNVAHVAELVDAADSKSAIRKGVKVRFLSWALHKMDKQKIILFVHFYLKTLFSLSIFIQT